MGKRIILVNPSYEVAYEGTKIKEGAPYSPNLALAVLSAPLIKVGHEVKIMDLNLAYNEKESFLGELRKFSPHYLGVTFTTPLFNEMIKISRWAKEYDSSLIAIGGGPHASSFPEQTLKDSLFDIVVCGEGDFILLDIVEGKDLDSINGIYYKKKEKIVQTPFRDYIKDLDILPYPAWFLYDLSKYKTTRLLCRKNPVGWIETSRGCIFRCVYCNKSVFGKMFRVKSPQRVIGEIEYMLNSGFREIHIADDAFTTDTKRAKEICDLIIKKGLHFPWAPVTGLRVDQVDKELLEKMHQSGCYRIYFGIESGNQKILNAACKGITIEQIRNAVRMCREIGLETFGFFMLALPGETEKTMQDTIDFAVELNLDMAKTSITIPLPATPLYNELNKKGLIKTHDWSKYNLYTPSNEIYEHENLNWVTVNRYFKKFYRRFYLRPAYILKRLWRDLIRGELFFDIIYFMRTKW